MADYFSHAWDATHSIEQGYSNHPNDPGGETMHGITARVARAHGYRGPMIHLPLEVAKRIARVEFWDRLRLEEIAQQSLPVALEVFDTNFNMWEGAAAEFLQRALNAMNNVPRHDGEIPPDLVVDGRIGAQTIWLLIHVLGSRRNREAETILLRTLNALQCADYVRQASSRPSKRDFFCGWVLKRVRIEQPVAEQVDLRASQT